MKSIIKVFNLKTLKDVSSIKKAIVYNQGIVACKINKNSGEVELVYDEYFINIDEIIECIEKCGYIVL